MLDEEVHFQVAKEQNEVGHELCHAVPNPVALCVIAERILLRPPMPCTGQANEVAAWWAQQGQRSLLAPDGHIHRDALAALLCQVVLAIDLFVKGCTFLASFVHACLEAALPTKPVDALVHWLGPCELIKDQSAP